MPSYGILSRYQHITSPATRDDALIQRAVRTVDHAASPPAASPPPPAAAASVVRTSFYRRSRVRRFHVVLRSIFRQNAARFDRLLVLDSTEDDIVIMG